MRLSKQQTAENRSRIVETAIRMFRRSGIEGVGIADLMRASGFTHGGFYNHFRSKEALVTETCRVSLERAERALERALSSGTPAAWHEYVASYLSLALDPEPSEDATLAALALEASRHPVELQRVFARDVDRSARTIGQFLSRSHAVAVGGGTAALRSLALHRLSALVGSWVLARAVSRANPELAREILRANRRWLGASEIRAESTRGRRSEQPRIGRRRPAR